MCPDFGQVLSVLLQMALRPCVLKKRKDTQAARVIDRGGLALW